MRRTAHLPQPRRHPRRDRVTLAGARRAQPDAHQESLDDAGRRQGATGDPDIVVDDDVARVDWARVKAELAADRFDNGRSPAALRLSFERSPHVAFAWAGDRLVGMARLLTDGVCNAYLLDVWTSSPFRRRGVAGRMVGFLLERVPGQHVGLQTDDAAAFYEALGFRPQPAFMSTVVGTWLDNEANRR